MNRILRNSVKRIVPQPLVQKLRQSLCGPPLSPYALVSYSQEGEDMVLRRMFEKQNTGFYVDVGAHHPQRFSNTYFFYLQGWRGINIDAMPGSMEEFKRERSRDINLEAAISDTQQELTYYKWSHPALNTFSEEKVASYGQLTDYYMVGQDKIVTRTLAEVLDEHLPSDQSIDFMSIDVEGLDYQVLKSNDWNKYRPGVILAEELERDGIENLQSSVIELYLKEQGYKLMSKTMNTLFFSNCD